MITTFRTETGAVALPTAPAVIFALLGLIDIALLGVVGSAVAPPLAVSIIVAALGLVTLAALIPARHGSRRALVTAVAARMVSALLAPYGAWGPPRWPRRCSWRSPWPAPYQFAHPIPFRYRANPVGSPGSTPGPWRARGRPDVLPAECRARVNAAVDVIDRTAVLNRKRDSVAVTRPRKAREKFPPRGETFPARGRDS